MDNDDDVVRDEDVYEQIQRLLDARDQQAFSRLLIDSVCSMPVDDFHRVREKLIKKFVDEQHTADDDITWPGHLTAKIKTDTDEQLAKEEVLGYVPAASDDVNSPALSLKIVNVRSCGNKETGGSWPYNVESQSRLSVADHIEDFTPTNYITIAPIETTDVASNDDDSTAIAGHQTQRQCSEVTDSQPISTICSRQPE